MVNLILFYKAKNMSVNSAGIVLTRAKTLTEEKNYVSKLMSIEAYMLIFKLER